VTQLTWDPETTELRFRHDNYGGVAFYTVKWCEEDHENCVIASMVGDDYRHHCDVADLTPIHDDEYCSGCGQIGCGWG
jgi:hypothetical protein